MNLNSNLRVEYMRYTRKRVKVPATVQRRMLEEHPYCSQCGSEDNLQIDHVDNDPGNSHRLNLQVLCQPCNLRKARVFRKRISKLFQMRRADQAQLRHQRKAMILELYTEAHRTTREIALDFYISERQVQRILNEAGVIRTHAEANRLTANRKPAIRPVRELIEERLGMDVCVWAARRRQASPGIGWRTLVDELYVLTGKRPSHASLASWCRSIADDDEL